MEQMLNRPIIKTINRRTIAIYQVAVIATFAFVFAGFAAALIGDHEIENEMGSPTELFSKLIDLNPAGFFGIGIGVMILAPVVMVADAAITFYRGGDKRYALITCAVAAILGFSILISFIWG